MQAGIKSEAIDHQESHILFVQAKIFITAFFCNGFPELNLFMKDSSFPVDRF